MPLFGKKEPKPQVPYDQVKEAFLEFMYENNSLEAKKEVLISHQTELLSDPDTLLDVFVEVQRDYSFGDDDRLFHILHNWDLIGDCRKKGIDNGFAENDNPRGRELILSLPD